MPSLRNSRLPSRRAEGLRIGVQFEEVCFFSPRTYLQAFNTILFLFPFFAVSKMAAADNNRIFPSVFCYTERSKWSYYFYVMTDKRGSVDKHPDPRSATSQLQPNTSVDCVIPSLTGPGFHRRLIVIAPVDGHFISGVASPILISAPTVFFSFSQEVNNSFGKLLCPELKFPKRIDYNGI